VILNEICHCENTVLFFAPYFQRPIKFALFLQKEKWKLLQKLAFLPITFPRSERVVSMTTLLAEFCQMSHQKSDREDIFGPETKKETVVLQR
jgi:hypothetical protein